jgi:hypothetical protein
MIQDALHRRVDRLAGAADGIPVIACHDTQVHLDVANALANHISEAHKAIGVEVGEVENSKPAEALGQVVIR